MSSVALLTMLAVGLAGLVCMAVSIYVGGDRMKVIHMFNIVSAVMFFTIYVCCGQEDVACPPCPSVETFAAIQADEHRACYRALTAKKCMKTIRMNDDDEPGICIWWPREEE